jgi:broad specificity phosphatase PhoE
LTTILLVRHGETVWNQDGRVQGHGDSPLSERGLAQADALATRLCRQHVDAVYSSDLGRAMSTVQPYATARSICVHATSALREKCFGEWEGLTALDLETRYPELWHSYHVERRIDTAIPGGESWDEVAERTVGLLCQVIQLHAGETVVMLGHGGALRPMILHALAAPLYCLRHISVENCGITTLRFTTPDDGRVISLNDCHHLEGIP